MRFVNIKEGSFVIDPQEAVDLVDENTICVTGILGSTYNGEFEDIKMLNDLLIKEQGPPVWTCGITWTLPAGALWPPSCTRSWSGISDPWCAASTFRAQVWAGVCGRGVDPVAL